ncbi:TVP38/TMEM64 family protein [Romboutsia sp. 1001216sp1]|uniref:TVP38/TMEM64 family protein n=1 Tax=Romboutsia sp. 1001216sp1 TaxID=2986997 RepID=UPI00232E9CBC|nr:TVP38/TMEM64 family protein [Romboutsia sp. 1001216sp1]MDB8805987.1 TVP38/TMEM64 family protein [Romboutsia sp. 1001216sp1]MDB8807569.1 TVP38/TMEM64 family protein [Romboutsia sp. 1001216sp1]MDB8811192.1 TVP38/TMEM64 family protein [Romboutsia sp. 1001216sp1]MDB8816912.1 TVP38/TMEM64 family protein [Romboutsia sp. 1001216sp1]MDB8819570.1 TVP38/TMEM64 family protein [Romboutsia sp. 1001216sp1]
MNNKLKKILVTIGILAFVVITNKYIGNNVDIYTIKEYVKTFGVLAPFIYIVMFSLVPLTFFPDSVLAISAGLIFGFSKGYIYTTIGALIGASIAFFIARYLGKEIIKRKSSDKLEKIERLIEKNGFYIIFLLRLIPLFPFDVISYGAGITNVKYKDFILSTLFGTIPGIAVFTNIGATSLNIKSTSFYISIALLVLLFTVSIFLKNKFLKDKLEEKH